MRRRCPGAQQSSLAGTKRKFSTIRKSSLAGLLSFLVLLLRLWPELYFLQRGRKNKKLLYFEILDVFKKNAGIKLSPDQTLICNICLTIW